jgi:hypothetical protein
MHATGEELPGNCGRASADRSVNGCGCCAVVYYSVDHGSTVNVTFGVEPQCCLPEAEVYAVDLAGQRIVHITDPPAA